MGEIAAELTPRRTAFRQYSRSPLATSQMHAVPSSLAETTRRSSGKKATWFTYPVCPCNVRSSFPVAASQSRTVSSKLELAINRPLGDQTAPVTK